MISLIYFRGTYKVVSVNGNNYSAVFITGNGDTNLVEWRPFQMFDKFGINNILRADNL